MQWGREIRTTKEEKINCLYWICDIFTTKIENKHIKALKIEKAVSAERERYVAGSEVV